MHGRLPAIRQCLARVDELDERLLAQQELLRRCTLEAERAELATRRLQMSAFQCARISC